MQHMNLREILLSEKSQCQKVIYGIIYMALSKRQNYRDGEKISGFQGRGGFHYKEVLTTKRQHKGFFWICNCSVF